MISDLPKGRLSHRKRVAKETGRELIPNCNRNTLWFCYFRDGILVRIWTRKGVIDVTERRYQQQGELPNIL